MKAAILGATGHIAQCALYALSRDRSAEFYLYSRSPDRLERILAQYPGGICHACGYDSFFDQDYDIVINGVGIWDTPGEDPRNIFRVTEQYDDMILRYQEAHPRSTSVHISSGAVYNNKFLAPISEEACAAVDINHIRQGDLYATAKLNSEVKHRAYRQLNIVDLRLFGFFSRFMDVGYNYMLSSIIRCIRDGKPFHAVREEFYRDYIHMDDLARLLLRIISREHINEAIDVRSRRPVSKSELLEYFMREYGLEIAGGGGTRYLQDGHKAVLLFRTCQ